MDLVTHAPSPPRSRTSPARRAQTVSFMFTKDGDMAQDELAEVNQSLMNLIENYALPNGDDDEESDY